MDKNSPRLLEPQKGYSKSQKLLKCCLAQSGQACSSVQPERSMTEKKRILNPQSAGARRLKMKKNALNHFENKQLA